MIKCLGPANNEQVNVPYSLYPNMSNIDVNQKSSVLKEKPAHFSLVLVVTELVVSGIQCTL